MNWKLILIILLLLAVAACSMNIVKKRLTPPHAVASGIMFQHDAPSARQVNLAGNFPDNLWAGTASSTSRFDDRIDPMYDDGTHGDLVAEDGIWTLIKKVSPGRYEYKYVIDRNTWVTDPNAVETTDDGYGGKNSVLTVK
ncbi:MAG: glycogen-binding domain-containing protein [Candidatus Cloacimonetes bacterium]|nr:glycogen-binding domain-containing protein [Candidatus Cloacimonadota bacterium]